MRNLKNFPLLAGVLLGFSMGACTPSKVSPLSFSEEKEPTANIISGIEVEEHSAFSKSVVFLVNTLTQEICTATLIGNQFALTAAHCLDQEDPNNLSVFFATKPSSQSEQRRVIAMERAPSGDIALIKFASATLPKDYKAAKFLPEYKKIQKGSPAIVLGYGINNARTRLGAGILRYTTLTVADPDYSPTEILLDQSKGFAVCHGDSGGPAFFLGQHPFGPSQLYLWGIANHVSPDDVNNHCNKGIIYTNALVYKGWIEKTMKEL